MKTRVRTIKLSRGDVRVLRIYRSKGSTRLVVYDEDLAMPLIQAHLNVPQREKLRLAAYKLVARTLGLGEVGLRLQVLTKTKKPKMIVEETDRTERDEREFIEIVVGVLRAVDGQVFFPIRTAMCGGCAFQRRCGST